MAKQERNVVTYGLSGKIGDLLVFRQKSGKTIVAKAPVRPGKASEKQTAHRQRFQQAVIYAKAAVASPLAGELYQTAAKKGKQPFNVAVADFFNAPDVHHIDFREYRGAVGDKTYITVSDDFAVRTVEVAISNSDGSPVESGAAVQHDGRLWIYTATQDNAHTEGDKIVITVSDLPGNVTAEEQAL
ncbi:MAG: hypothetical protein LBS46_00860 [Dysgonamonadaceae bacterium]|jgi:hypothetical protein|nr:hypothetical protein [Dysgonamonadaceae bacterium]